MTKIEIREMRHRRYRVYLDGTFIAAYTIGEFRPYVYPLCTPTGLPLTEESPADHPHHQSVWLAQDEVNGVNFWLNRPGCGRVVGSPPEVAVEELAHGPAAVFRHELTWIGPAGPVLTEQRVTAIAATGSAVLVDIESQRRPAGDPVTFGMTKEAGLGIRVQDFLDEEDGGTIVNSNGDHGQSGTFDREADWVDYSGRAAGGTVGVALFPHPDNPRHAWFTRSYGLVTANHHRFVSQTVMPGEQIALGWRIAAHDGSADDADVADLYRHYQDQSAGTALTGAG